MTVNHPWLLMLVALALLPFLWQRPRAIFSFSSFISLPRNKLSQAASIFLKVIVALAVVSLTAGISGISLKDVKYESIEEGSQIVFVRDLSGSMWSLFGTPGSKESAKKVKAATDVIEKFARSRPRDQYGLIDFGGAAVTRSKLIFDKERFLEILRQEAPNLGTTVIGKSLERAIALFPYEHSLVAKAIILVSDGGGSIENYKDLMRWMRELNISFWWVFIGDESDWTAFDAQNLRGFISELGPQAKIFRADNPANLNNAMVQIRDLQRGLIRYPTKVYEYPLDSFFYGIAFGCFAILGLFLLLELSLRPGGADREG